VSIGDKKRIDNQRTMSRIVGSWNTQAVFRRIRRFVSYPSGFSVTALVKLASEAVGYGTIRGYPLQRGILIHLRGRMLG
jgi:hypothetical protein